MIRSCIVSVILLYMLPAMAQEPTWYKDIAPIVIANCAPCHQPGEAAPFSLLTYENVAKRASFIRKVVASRDMPPWRADGQYTHFANERSLNDKQIALITTWIDHKMPEGRPAERTARPPYPRQRNHV